MLQDCLLKSAVSHCKVAFASFFARLRDNSECLAARKGKSSPKSIFPAFGNSRSASFVPYQINRSQNFLPAIRCHYVVS